ncbi:fibrinogen-related protein 2.2 [Plakobranchus ocellatus]|uniref:Fibrinogen-related protein 2.2 n=1 Tax=Plakobranchus ocellatus TaxID=259542 RepID=A0AAV4BD52_9GAST|nr:fibrinogen-related protein 2.2 [Plakobranchus ocellatus]
MARVMTKSLLLAMMMVMNVFAETKDVAESLSDLERKLTEISASLNKTNEKHAQLRGHQELPTICERGMGDDITKTYPRYVIMSHDGPKRQILCDTHTDGGGWVVFQRRATGDVDFYRDWTSYREGFGSLTGDFWMGNEALYNLTDKDPYELRIDIRINNGQKVFARYPDFRIESESNKYRLQIGSYTGTAGDAMAYHNKMFFSTFDRDNDEASGSCAVSHHGAWWYKNCIHSELNREWAVTETKSSVWNDGKKSWKVSFTEMKMRRIKLI